MTRDHDPFTQALMSLRARTTAGAYGPGQPIVIVEEAKRLRVSVTPVREALSWLSGEGLVERAMSGGYFAPRLDAAIVRDRYGFHLTCLLAAVALAPSPLKVRPAGQSLEARAIFDQIIDRSGSLSLTDAYRRVASLLGMFASVEATLLSDCDTEAQDLERRRGDPNASGLIEALTRYHQRRIDHAADLLVVLHDRSQTADAAVL